MRAHLISVLILAAGKGTRMKSAKAKVLHEVFFVPMIHHVLNAVSALNVDRTIAVVGHQRQEVENSLASYPVSFAFQKEQLGTGHAVAITREQLSSNTGTVLILCGDTPLIRSETLQAMLEEHIKSEAILTVMTTELSEPQGYGRILKDAQGVLSGIVEEKDATDAQKKIREINAGVYAVESGFLFDALDQVDSDNAQGEIYLTDIVGIASQEKQLAKAFACNDPEEVLGVNSRAELALAHARLQERRNSELMKSGVTMICPDTIQIEDGVEIGPDTFVDMNVQISGHSFIGEGCRIGPNCYLANCRIGRGSNIGPNCVLRDFEVQEGQDVLPLTKA